jgi:LPS sulfotransferase NodH
MENAGMVADTSPAVKRDEVVDSALTDRSETTSEIEKFIILSHGRTGSTTLRKAISAHPDVQVYGEVFHKKGGRVVNGKEFVKENDAGEFCRDVIFKSPNEFGKRVVGFKMFFFHARRTERQYSAWRYLISDPSIKVVLLSRKSIFDSYISARRSRRSGFWKLRRDETIAQKHQSPISIDAKDCYQYMLSTVAQTEWGKRVFAAHPFMEVFFEDLQANSQTEYDRIFQFLGVEPKPIAIKFEKLMKVPHSEGIVNYDELRSHFQFSVFREFFIPE